MSFAIQSNTPASAESPAARQRVRDEPEPARRAVWQGVAIAGCMLLGLAMIVNNQLGGEAMWFWYANLFHNGVKLYAGLHTPHQPLFVLEMDAWMVLFGHKNLVVEIPSVFHVLLLCLGIFAVLRETAWPDWKKALALAGAFGLTICGHSYRFDDYHVISEALMFFAMAVLLQVWRSRSLAEQLRRTALLGLLCGLIATTRLTDGAAITAAAAVCLTVMSPRKKLLSVCLSLAMTVVVIAVVVRLTGDTYADWLSATVIKAAAVKGGGGHLFRTPLQLLLLAVHYLHHQGKVMMVLLFGSVLCGALAQRRWRLNCRQVIWLELAVFTALALVVPVWAKSEVVTGYILSVLVLLSLLLTFALTPVVGWRAVRALKDAASHWDGREVLILLPLADWASYSAASSGEPLTNFYSPVALFVLLLPILQPAKRYAAWLYPSFLAGMVLIAVFTITSKVLTPYQWENYRVPPMFAHRQWYEHPVYGPMYMDTDLLRFSRTVCGEIAAGRPNPQLLSLPFPFPNYFCDLPPWHGYVQTFFDTSTRATIMRLMGELETDPPQWIVYQRQLKILRGAEYLYNGGQPLAQRDLDTMIMNRIHSGQWRLVDKQNYLEGDGWFIIQTNAR